jgi:glycosyltransferase involved in cell wall biosynthesis
MSKHKILFASSLKPAFDVRTEKLFLSFRDRNQFDCHFCGVHSPNKNKKHNVHSWKYSRGLFSRLFINFRYIFILLRIKPQTIILNNNDIQLLSVYYKKLFNTKLIFDIQENTIKNITYQEVYFGLKKRLYIFLSNLSNKSLSRHCSGFILAEKCYAEELLFIKNKPSIILENKSLPTTASPAKTKLSTPIQLLFSGTISQTSGIYIALEWFKILNKISVFELTIIGHTTDVQLHKQLTLLAINNRQIKYKGATSPLPHSLIENAISDASFGLICYEITPANQNKIPTKLYEYLAFELPIICQEHPNWNRLIDDKKAGIIFNQEIKRQHLEQVFYTQNSSHGVFWDEQKLSNWFLSL